MLGYEAPPLDQLKSKMSQFNNTYIKYKKIEKSPQNYLLKCLKVPAYLRYEHLASAASKLPLPCHYKFLGEVFRAVETASSMLINRKESVTFSKIKPAAQEMLKRNVTEKHLAQIRSLCPEMYTFNSEKLRNFDTTSKKDEYELVMTPQKLHAMMTPSIIVERQKKFHNSLIERVKIYHERFLMTLDIPTIVPHEKLDRWHPEFNLENVPDVDYDLLPEAPNVEYYTTMQDMLSKAKKMLYNPRLQKGVRKRRQKNDWKCKPNRILQTPPFLQSVEKISSPDPIIPLNPALKNIPNSLLRKARARQAEKAQRKMTMSSMQEENLWLTGS